MKMRAPDYPLITVDPYFSVWSDADRLYDGDTKAWHGKPARMFGIAEIDGTEYRFMGSETVRKGLQTMRQTAVDVTAFSTSYSFEAAGVRLNAVFTTPVLPDNLELLSRPASYLEISYEALDGAEHSVSVQIYASQDFCVEHKMSAIVRTEDIDIGKDIAAMRMGGIEQPVLGRSGDDIGIDWGYLYLAVCGGTVTCTEIERFAYLCASAQLAQGSKTLLVFAYDDIYSIKYFGTPLQAYWKRNGASIEQVIEAAFAEYEGILTHCSAFHKKLYSDAAAIGGEKYAELLILALRQIMAAHKLVVDTKGQLVYVSKECLSNGCAATVDVSYPSYPFFLLYNPALAEAMLRPILEYASGNLWPHAFAPHDLGTYPILNGQVYRGMQLDQQMPVEECGNMLIMASALFSVGETVLSENYRMLLNQWADYLTDFGADPSNQLCTDDFAGHLAHNCNLGLKSIMALAAYARVCGRLGDTVSAERYSEAAKKMAEFWKREAANEDGTFRLAFDQPGTFSMKYNAVWDRVLGLKVFSEDMWKDEIKGYIRQLCPYGLPLDNRADYTKSDWMMWTATLTDDEVFFNHMTEALWRAYHYSPSRVPMTDWFSTVTSLKRSFQHRSVQGGLYIRLLCEKDVCHL